MRIVRTVQYPSKPPNQDSRTSPDDPDRTGYSSCSNSRKESIPHTWPFWQLREGCSRSKSVPNGYLRNLATSCVLCSTCHHIGILRRLVGLGLLVVPLRPRKSCVSWINIEGFTRGSLAIRLPSIVCHCCGCKDSQRGYDPLI